MPLGLGEMSEDSSPSRGPSPDSHLGGQLNVAKPIRAGGQTAWRK